MESFRVEVIEVGRRLKRLTDSHMTRRRILILLLFLIFVFLYIGPSVMRWLWYREAVPTDPQGVCIKDRLAPFLKSAAEHDVYIRYGNTPPEDSYVPYIGNGMFGLTIDHDAFFNIKSGRSLTLPVYYKPIINVKGVNMNEATVTDYLNGIIHSYSCSEYGYNLINRYYAHRTIPSLFVQEIRISNPTSDDIALEVDLPNVIFWPTAVKRVMQMHNSNGEFDFQVVTGYVEAEKSKDEGIAVSIVSRILPTTISLSARNSVTYNTFTTIHYTKVIKKDEYADHKDVVESAAITLMEKVLKMSEDENAIKQLHTNVWQQLWYTGFSISESKAQNAINGDKINATMYYVLSQVRAYEFEEGITAQKKNDILRALTYAEGCYKGHYTLQAPNLWKPLDSLYQMNSVVGAWLLTLEKQGCHNLLHAGASGVVQAMILSFGGLRFSNQHLEFNIHPSNLHRDFLFRRINYGNMTHVNISVIVQEDNKAVLYVALDRSDGMYYACDGGCLDTPIQLGPARKQFPVKLTDPLTAILYITSDKQHMEDLRHTIHVQEVGVAPAHEHHVIALHKHGHSLGGLPILFWVSVCMLIVLFHLFLCRIIVTEFCDSSSDKYRRLYSKP